MKRPIDLLVWFYNQRAGAENLIKEANNDAGLAAHPSGRWATNCVHFQLAMLAYNLNCWLLLFQREETDYPHYEVIVVNDHIATGFKGRGTDASGKPVGHEHAVEILRAVEQLVLLALGGGLFLLMVA